MLEHKLEAGFCTFSVAHTAFMSIYRTHVLVRLHCAAVACQCMAWLLRKLMRFAQRAAQSLNVRLATLKVHLRVLGVSKWPSRKRSSIRKLLRHCPDLQGTPKQRVSQMLACRR